MQISRDLRIGDGPANNSYFDISFHLTIPPDGKIASEFTRAEGRRRQDGRT